MHASCPHGCLKGALSGHARLSSSTQCHLIKKCLLQMQLYRKRIVAGRIQHPPFETIAAVHAHGDEYAAASQLDNTTCKHDVPAGPEHICSKAGQAAQKMYAAALAL